MITNKRRKTTDIKRMLEIGDGENERAAMTTKTIGKFENGGENTVVFDGNAVSNTWSERNTKRVRDCENGGGH
jgi:hypothetical protein